MFPCQQHPNTLTYTPVSSSSIVAGKDTFSHYAACMWNDGSTEVFQWLAVALDTSPCLKMRNRFCSVSNLKIAHTCMKLPAGHRASKRSRSIGWGAALMCTHAHVLLKGRVRADVQRMPYNKVGVRLWSGFYFLWMGAGRHPVSVGYRISQPLWQIENHSASLCGVTHLGSWQENAQIKEFPFVRRLQIAAVVLDVDDKLQRNWKEPDYC